MSRRAHVNVGGSEQERLVNDRAQYIAFLEQQLERVSAACQNVQYMDEKLDHLKQTQNTYEAKISNLAKLVKLDKQHTEKIKTDTSEYTDNLKKRILFLEEKSREKFDKVEETLGRLEGMYSAFPTDAAALSTTGGAQPQGLPGFIATYIHSLFTQHTQQTATSLTHQSQTHQIHLQNWVQEYIKTTHPSSKLLDEVNSFKLELHSIAHKMNESENRVIGLIEKRMSGYTEIYQTMEERFLNVVDVHHKKLAEAIATHETKLRELASIQAEIINKSDAQSKESQHLVTEFQEHKETTQNFLNVIDDMKLKLDSGILDFNTNINNLVLELREKTWHAEQTCSRLAVDTISRQNIFHKKLEAHIQSKYDALQQEFQAHLSNTKQVQSDLQHNMHSYEKKMDKLTKKTENRIQILATTIKDRFDEDSPPRIAPSDSSASSSSVVHQLNTLNHFVRDVDAKVDALRQELDHSQQYIQEECKRTTDQQISHLLHDQLDKVIEDKIYLVERANHAHDLARKTEQLAGQGVVGDLPTPVASQLGARPVDERDWRALKAELNTEIKKNLSAMHATLEEKLKSVERKSHMSTLEHSRSIGTSLQQYEEKSRQADDVLRKVQELYNAMQGRPIETSNTATAVTPAVSSPRTHRPASPTLYPRAQSIQVPVRPPSPPPPQPQPAPTSFPNPPPFASTLPYYHDPKDPHQPFLAHASAPQGAYVPAASHVEARPNPIHTYTQSARTRDTSPVTTGRSSLGSMTDVRDAADSALARALSPLRHRSGSPPNRLPPRLSPGSGIHHHAATDDLYLRTTGSRPYALIPSHFPPAAAPTSFFDRNRSLDDSDLTTDRALTTGLGNIDQLLRSMEFMEQAEKKKKIKKPTTDKPKSLKPIPMKRTGGGFVAPNLLQGSAPGSSLRSKSPYVEDEDEDPFLKQSRRNASTRAGRQ